jgi:hypothetical protein
MRYWLLYEFIRLFSLATLASLIRAVVVICIIAAPVVVLLGVMTPAEALSFSVMFLGVIVILDLVSAFPGRIGEIFENYADYNQALVLKLREYRRIIECGGFETGENRDRPVPRNAISPKVAAVSVAATSLNTAAFVLIVLSSFPMAVRALAILLLFLSDLALSPRFFAWSRHSLRSSRSNNGLRPRFRRRQSR